MAAPSSGGTTVGEALNILESTDLAAVPEVEYLHRFIESTKLAFADRLRWVGDPAFSRCRPRACSRSGSPTTAPA